MNFLPTKLIGFVIIISLTTLPFLIGCKKWTPPQTANSQPFQNRITSESQGEVTVFTAVPSREETRQIFGADLYGVGVQPVWFRITNAGKEQLALLPSSIDPEYFSPNEVAYKSKGGYSKKGQWDREIFFQKMSLPNNIPAYSETSGFVMTHVDKRNKYFYVDIFSDAGLKRFSFFLEVPFKAGEFTTVDIDSIYSANQIQNLSLDELRTKLEQLPCCVPGTRSGTDGDPLNLVIIGNDEDALSAIIRSGWQEYPLNKKFKKPLDTALAKRPHSHQLRDTLYLFDRREDVSFYKPRKKFHERNQFSVWLTPWRYQGKRVWVGTITRDIGLRYYTEREGTLVTHKIDSDVDETREYLLEDLVSVEALDKIAWVKGVGASTPENPRKDAVGDHWYSDGLRSVLFIGERPVDVSDIQTLDWEFPPRREPLDLKTSQSELNNR